MKKPKSYWNYRVVKKDDIYYIAEVRYENDEIVGYSDYCKNALIWDGYENLKGTVDLIKKAFKKPVLDWKELEKISKSYK